MAAERQNIAVTHSSDVSAARSAARAMALACGFSATAAEEIALVATELASNLIKHANGGTIVLSPASQNGAGGIQIESHDSGPGIRDVELAVGDGFSTARSLGYGLGTVNRLMDQFEIAPHDGPGSGTHLVCRRFVRPDARGIRPGPLDIGAATRAHPLMAVNGDAFVIKRWGEGALVGIIDGLGHGPHALRAAETARQFVESHFDQPLLQVFTGVGRACRATRGVVMALARFVWTADQSSIRLTFASVGNIEVRVFGSPESMDLAVVRGILGIGTLKPVVAERRWEPGYLMVLHSDGCSTHWRWADYPELAEASADSIAHHLLLRLAKDQDDATMLVVRSAQPDRGGGRG